MQGSDQSRGRAALGGGGWRDVRELNNKEHWPRFNNVFDRVLGGGVEIAQLDPHGGMNNLAVVQLMYPSNKTLM